MFDQRINQKSFEYYKRLNRVKSFVESNLDRPITADQAAQVAGLSPGYFSTFFKEKTGVRFSRWVTHLRVERAKQRLEEHNEPITQLAYSAGYRDVRTFERAFKRLTGQTPHAFKVSNRPS